MNKEELIEEIRKQIEIMRPFESDTIDEGSQKARKLKQYQKAREVKRKQKVEAGVREAIEVIQLWMRDKNMSKFNLTLTAYIDKYGHKRFEQEYDEEFKQIKTRTK